VAYLNVTAHRDLVDGIRHEQLSLSQLQLLERLRHGGKPTIRQAAALMKVTCSTASSSVTELARRGLVRREPSDDDYRSKRIEITPRGQDVLKRLHAARMPAIVAFTHTLDPAQRKQLDAALGPIVQRPDVAPYRPKVEAA
jgi:MarR family 2-MHQ and catechol resistance regulon transcriptional repressor